MASSSPPWCRWSELLCDILVHIIDRLQSTAGHRRGFWSAACSWLLFWSACYWLLWALLGSLARLRVAWSSRKYHTADSVDDAQFGAMYRSWRMADSVDRAHFRAAYRAHCMVEAACRLWPAAANEHLPCLPRRRLLWVILSYPYFITSSDNSSSCRHRFPYLSKNMTCIGSTNDWIALSRVVVGDVHSYLLHNHFPNMAELGALTADTSRIFKVLKVLMGPADPCHRRVWPMWSELLPDILGLVIDRLASSLASSLACPSHHHMADSIDHTTDSTDRARFRAAYRSWCTMDSINCTRFRVANRAHRIVKAVCRPWCAVALEHLPCPPRRLPWILENHYYHMKSSDAWGRRLPSLPENAMCIGCTDDWIAISTSCTILSLTRPCQSLSALIGNNVSVLFEIRKVLMRSTPQDVVAIMTNNYNYPIILVRPGKGMWLPRPRAAPFIYIIDIAFIGDTLYGITKGEDLLCLDIALDEKGFPPALAKRVIRHPFKVGNHSKVWSNTDLFHVWSYPYKLDDGYDLWSDVDEKYHKYVGKDKDGQDAETLIGGHDEDRIHYEISHGLFITTWQIVKSLGKLLMVRRKLHWLERGGNYTRSADVFEADIAVGAWVPVKDGLHGQALFISRYCCKSVHACGVVDKDAIYFVDTGEVLNMRSKIISQPQRNLYFRESLSILRLQCMIVSEVLNLALSPGASCLIISVTMYD
ncbi:hypothetical protein VPH35_048375 [Triticum aestivum]